MALCAPFCIVISSAMYLVKEYISITLLFLCLVLQICYTPKLKMTMHYVVVSDGIDATWGEHLSTGECSISHTFQVQ